MTLSGCNHLAHLIVLLQIKKIICYCTVFALFYFVFEGNFQVQGPGGLYSEGRLYGGFFCVTSWGGGGAYFGGGFFWEFYGTASQSRNILQTFIRRGGGHKLSPHHASVCKFSQLCMAISSLA